MTRNPKSDLVHQHNGLLGSLAIAKNAMRNVMMSPTTSDSAKELAAELWDKIQILQIDVNTNRNY